MSKSKEELLKYAELLEALHQKKKYSSYDFFFTDKGPTARSLYSKHIEYMKAGDKYSERMFSAGNQTGKTTAILYEAVTHLRLSYQDWWEGKRFKTATIGIIGAKNWELIRDGVQSKLLGDHEHGTGLIPKADIVKCISAPGTPGAFSQIHIRNKRGTVSKLMFKTYDSGKDSWESMTIDFCFFDEEPPRDIYVEGSIRTLKKNGVTAIGFTPDSGLTDTVLEFFKDGDFKQGVEDDKFVTMCGWNDVPHLDEKKKESMMRLIPEYLREAKCNGLPYLGAGRVFPFNLDSYFVDSFPIPEYYEKFYGLDVGIKNTACVWVARDPDTQSMFIYDEYLCHDQIPNVHVGSLKERGDWISGVVDPYLSVARSTTDGQRLIEVYQKLGLHLYPAERNTKESGIEALKVAFMSDRLKIFKNCRSLFTQLNLYHRDDKGKTGRTPDDLVDALRYAISCGQQYAASHADWFDEEYKSARAQAYLGNKRNKITGY